MDDILKVKLREEETLKLKLKEEEKLKLKLTGSSIKVDMDNVHIDTTANWNAQPQLVGKRGHLYIYKDYTVIDGVEVPAFKVGDGSAYLIDAPFVAGNDSKLNAHILDANVHIQDGEREFWNNKVTAFLSQGDDETLVLTKKSEEEYNNG